MPDQPLKDLYAKGITGSYDNSPVQPDVRAAAIGALRQIFGTATQAPNPPPPEPRQTFHRPDEYGGPNPHVPEIFTAGHPAPYSKLEDDPIGEAATQELMREYPRATQRVENFRVGQSMQDPIAGLTESSLGGTPIVSLAPTDHTWQVSEKVAKEHPSLYVGGSPFQTQMEILRHELSHVLGFPDESDGSRLTAYDVGSLSSQLGKDIALPTEGQVDPRLAGLKMVKP